VDRQAELATPILLRQDQAEFENPKKGGGEHLVQYQVLPEFGLKPELQDHKRRTACAV
jgi:hypothetical protein